MFLLDKIFRYPALIFAQKKRLPAGRYTIVIIALFLAEELLVLNGMYFVLLPVFDLPHEGVYRLMPIVINLSYLLCFAMLRVEYDDVRELYTPMLIRRNFLKLTGTALCLFACLFFPERTEAVSPLFMFAFFGSVFFF